MENFGIIGQSKEIQEVLRLVHLVGDKNLNVLITGPSGTGKELVAKALHHLHKQGKSPFQAVNVSAIPDTLLESELFGYHKGAFTGAEVQRKGLLELAKGGIVFLDEIGDMSAAAQAKMLRALEEHAVMPLGSGTEVSTHFRAVAATSTDLSHLISQGKFRLDLFHRLDEMRIDVPALKDRLEDLPLLIDHFLKRFCEELAVPLKKMSDSSLALWRRYSWPGNIRELRNLVKKAVVLTKGPTIWIDSLPIDFHQAQVAPEESSHTEEILSLDEMEKRHIGRVLNLCRWNKKRAAEFLRIDRSSLYNKIKKYGISPIGGLQF